ncbi:MAG: HEAT repeat domain-containing protein [Acidobacteria bacterium]|nr:HEAT repeat domain-containing protein [Acidobacteriota bacterium]
MPKPSLSFEQFYGSLKNAFYLTAAAWLLALSVFAQTDFEAQSVARLTTGDEEARLSGLVELATLFKTPRREPRPATTAALIQVLSSDPQPVLRTHAARVLEYAAPSSATDALLTALARERELATRKAVIYALARYHAAPVTVALIPFLRHKEAELRATAAYALAELADTASASALHECLVKRRGDQDAFTRAEAARALGRIGYRAASPDLRKALMKDAALVQRAAAEALGWLATTQEAETVAALQSAAQAEDPYLRAAATLALQRIRQRAAS